jgi:hypothetical protein
MALDMNPKVFSGFVEEKLDDGQGAEVFVDLVKLLLKADGESTMDDILKLLDEARDNFDSNYRLIKTKLEQQ